MEMGGKNLKCLASFLFICVFIWCFSLQNCHAREGRHWIHRKTGSGRESEKKEGSNTGFGRHRRHVHRHRGGSGLSRLMGGGHVGSENVVAASLASRGGSANFNVLDFGAKGDGRADDTKAFQAAWEAACKAEGSTVVVPSGSDFLVGPISFSGPEI